MNDHDEDVEQPWTEEQWEEFMKQADLRAARFGELMETLIDHPDRDEIIDREMGWDKREPNPEFDAIMEEAEREVTEAEERGENILDEIAREQDPGEMLPESVLGDKADDEFFDLHDRQLHRLPSYHLAERFSKRLDELLVPHMEQHSDDSDEDVAQAYIQIKIAAAKIAGGHQMGYHDEVIGGNVVNCKRARAAVEECRLALQSLLDRKVFSPDVLNSLLEELSQVHAAIEKRIAELRARMWWQES